MGGLRYIVGEPDRPPSRVGISIGDSLAAVHACMGTLAALHHRERTGAGQVVDAAIYESVLNMMESLVTEYDQLGHVRERSGPILPRIAPSNVYPTRDGIVMIGANQDTVFARLCRGHGDARARHGSALSRSPGARREPAGARCRHRAAGPRRLDTRDLLDAARDSTACPRGSSIAPPTCSTIRISWRARPSSAHRIPQFGKLRMQNVAPRLSAEPEFGPHAGAGARPAQRRRSIGELLGLGRRRPSRVSRAAA